MAASRSDAIPPSLFETVIKGLGAAGRANGARAIVEKPFGRDLASARELNRVAQSVFPEASIFRIDHFLGKEAIMNVRPYRRGSWGPKEADAPIKADGGWHNPRSTETAG